MPGEPPEASPRAGEALGSPAPAAGANILIVDDDDDNLFALEAVLEPLGQRIVRAMSGEEALRALLKDEFAVILLDVRMPGMDGFETARYINARERTRHTPIIFLTGHHAETGYAFAGYEAGAVDYVVKPFDPDVMRSKVSVFVKLHEERRQRVLEAHGRAQAEAVASTVRKLQSLSDVALAHLELGELLPQLLDRTTALFDADTAGVLLVEADASRLRLSATHGLESFDPEAVVRAGDGFLGRALYASGAVALADVDAEAGLHPSLEATGVRSLLASPLVVAERRLGVLYVGSPQRGHFSGDDAELMGLGAERAAIALDHARSYEHERESVELLQRSLLPERLPSLPGLDVAARYVPSGSAAMVGGDWYDAIALPGDRVAVVIGDVVGHGIRAATVMGELRNGLRAYLLEGHGAGEAVMHLNRLVESIHGAGMAATLVVVTLDPRSGKAQLANAGHLPALLISAGGEGRFIEHHAGMPLGVGGATKEHPELELEIPLDATLLVFTDGLVERRGRSIDDGLERLLQAAGRGPDDLDGLCSQILRELVGDQPVGDDAALLAVRRRPQARGRLELHLPAEQSSVPVARHALAELLAAHDVDEDASFALKLALSEAAANAVEHAYGPGDHEFEVVAEIGADGVTLTVTDNGQWRPSRGEARGRGRGLVLIEEFADSVELERGESGTVVRVFKRLGPSQQRPHTTGAEA